ncbi:MAG TPA: cyclic nucleotide-binding domain-containing protein [Acidimicrobiales bacterium]|nr:cyclic nucleotide-binding domain-containing protein [Acidimicrobiales bacterium]
MGRQTYVDELAKVPLFSTCSKAELQAIGRATDELTLGAGRVLCEQGGMGREAFVIVDGEAEVRRNNRRVAALGPGDCVGELALLDRQPRTATVTASTDLRVLVIGTREFEALLATAPSIMHKLLGSLGARLRGLDTKAFG